LLVDSCLQLRVPDLGWIVVIRKFVPFLSLSVLVGLGLLLFFDEGALQSFLTPFDLLPSAKLVSIVKIPTNAGTGIDLCAFSNSCSQASITCNVTGNNIAVSPADTNEIIWHRSDSPRFLRINRKDPEKPYDYRYNCVVTARYSPTFSNYKKDFQYEYPFPFGTVASISTGPGEKEHNRENRSEYAIDFVLPDSSPVVCVRDGEVVACQDSIPIGFPCPSMKQFVNSVVVRHDDGTLAEYAHLKHGAVFVTLGERVKAGMVIGLVGSTGYSSGPHLHFSIQHVDDSGVPTSIPITFAPTMASLSLSKNKRIPLSNNVLNFYRKSQVIRSNH